MRRAVFWDRDGTLMREVDYCDDPAKVTAIGGAREALRSLRNTGWLNVIISNQSGIGRGYFTVQQYEAVTAELRTQLDGLIDAVYYCPDAPGTPSRHRKPATGMVEDACRDLGIDPKASWFVGDKDVDVQCGRAAGCRTILVRTGYGAGHIGSGEDFVAADAAAAAQRILDTKQAGAARL